MDFYKVLDTVNHNYLWEALYQRGVDKKVIRILVNIYSSALAYVRLDQNGTEIKLEKGVKKGGSLSPHLFNAVTESVFRELEWHNNGLKINGARLKNLKFADDIILISDNRKDIRRMVLKLLKTSRKTSLQVNAEKTK